MNKQLENAIKVSEVLINHGYEAYFVGGFVRDSIMNHDAKDIDITTNALPEDVQKLFVSHIDTGIKHGTVSVRVDKDSEFYEVTTYRIDGKYDDGRHPNDVVFTPSLKEDLARRDFTMNAIAKNPINGAYVDPFKGRKDIENGLVRCVGDAKQRFMEDPLRVLRAMRFAIKYGFAIEKSTKIAMHDIEVLKRLDECISKERITDELRKMLVCGNSIRDIFMEFSDIICVIIPEMKPCVNAPHNSRWHKHDIYDHILHVVDLCKSNKFEIKLAALLHDIGKPACRIHDNDSNCDHFNGHPVISMELAKEVFVKDLKISTKEKERVLTLILHHDDHINPEPKNIRKFIVNTSEDFVRDWIFIKEADLMDHNCPIGEEEKWNDTRRRFELFKTNIDEVVANENAFKITDLVVDGKDIMELFNVKPGPIIGQTLKALFEAVLDEQVENDRDALLELARTLA